MKLYPQKGHAMANELGSNTSLATVVAGLATKGCRKLLITSSTPGEGTSSVVAQAGRALACASDESVLLIDADPRNPSLRRAFGLQARRGLTELIEEVYLVEPMKEDPLQFGLGDWFEILRAQRRTGDLEVREGDQVYTLRFVKGSIYSIACPDGPAMKRLGEVLVEQGRLTAAQNEEGVRIHEESGRPYGDVLRALSWLTPGELLAALRTQVRDRLARLVALRLPEGRFTELAEPHRAAAGGRAIESSDGVIDELVYGPMREYFKRPFLSSQIPSYFSDTGVSNLKVLTAGQRECDLIAPRHREGFALLLDHLGGIFDLVLIDAPPVTRAGVTVGLAGQADGVLIVVRAGSVPASTVLNAVEKLRRADANILGIVLNEAGEDEPDTFAREVSSHVAAHPA